MLTAWLESSAFDIWLKVIYLHYWGVLCYDETDSQCFLIFNVCLAKLNLSRKLQYPNNIRNPYNLTNTYSYIIEYFMYRFHYKSLLLTKNQSFYVKCCCSSRPLTVLVSILNILLYNTMITTIQHTLLYIRHHHTYYVLTTFRWLQHSFHFLG